MQKDRMGGLRPAARSWLLALICACSLPGWASAQDTNTVTSAIERPPAFQSPGSGLIGAPPKIDQAQPLYLQGDSLIYDNSGQRVTARGNVEIYYNNYILKADEVTYDQRANRLTAKGNVVLKEPSGTITRSEQITLTDDFRDGFVQSLSFTARDDTKITAARANRRGGNVTEFEQGKFTPCKSTPGAPPLWCISANRVVHDQNAATISYQDAAFELFGVPVLYLPYFEHADPTVKRKSGFLTPGYSHSSDLGSVAEVPYYFALSPSYDFTFVPTYTSEQGMLWQGVFRQKLAAGSVSGEYKVEFAAIDQDAASLPGTVANASALDGLRGSVKTTGAFSLSSWWNFGWDVTLESDDSFRRFYKLDSILQTDRVNTAYLRGQSERNYFALTGYHFGGLLLTDQDNSESRVHPVLDWNYVVGAPVFGGELSWNVNAISFSRDQSFQTIALGATNGVESTIHRASADVNWRRKLTDQIGITYTPFANLRGNAITVRNTVNPLDDTLIEQRSELRGTASAGVLAAYPWIKRTANASHTIAPIGQIIARTARAGTQNILPNEDARSLVFDDTNLFELDKHSGYDRLETGTRANVGVEYTFQLNTGGYARLLAGQSFHLAGDNVYADAVGNQPTTNVGGQRTALSTTGSGLASDRSDYVIGAYLAPDSSLRFIGQARFDEENFALRRSDIYAIASYGPFTGQVTYSYTAADTSIGEIGDQQDIIAALNMQISERWSLGGAIRYDIDEEEIRQNALSLRYADECIVITATYADSFIEDTERGIDRDQSVMLRFEPKHLGDFRYRTNALDFVGAENQ